MNNARSIEMAKVEGPLFSMQASGTYGGAVTFGRRKGRNVARIRVDPANPQTAGQQASRNRMRVVGAAQRFLNSTSEVEDGQSATGKVQLTALAPSEQTWNSYLGDVMIGAGAIAYQAAESAYAALDAGSKSAWDGAAASLTPAINAVPQKEAGGADGTPKTAGEVFFIMQYGLNQAGAAAAPTGTPPTYS
jgi:hypothetical protein